MKIVQAGLDRIVYIDNQNEKDREEILKGWNLAKKAIENDEYQLIILDEANIAIDLGIIDVDEVVDVLKNKPDNMEIVLTGRNAHPKIIEIAHLVSNIEPVKHYWDTGIAARKGIEENKILTKLFVCVVLNIKHFVLKSLHKMNLLDIFTIC